jgi:hypothetical protein
MPSAMLKKAVKDGLITQKQYDKMPEKMLEGLVKAGGNKGLQAKRRKKRKSTTYPKNKKGGKDKK